MKSILDKSFRYTDSAHTDVRATIRKEMKRIADAKAREVARELTVVRPIQQRGK